MSYYDAVLPNVYIRSNGLCINDAVLFHYNMVPYVYWVEGTTTGNILHQLIATVHHTLTAMIIAVPHKTLLYMKGPFKPGKHFERSQVNLP